jgi:hypothetical protein
VVFGAVQCDQYPPAEALEWGEHLRGLDRLDEQRIEGRRRGTIQHLADVVVAGGGGNGEQRLAVRASLSLCQAALIRQERRATHEEQRERGEADIRHRVGADGQRPFAPVGETGTDLPQRGNAFLKGTHASSESRFAARRKAVIVETVPSERESRPWWHWGLTPTTPIRIQNATQSH